MTIYVNIQPIGGAPKWPIPIQQRTYEALITQLGTNNPTEIILRNTTKNTITWTRNNTGDYYGDLINELNMDKTEIICNGGLLAAWNFNIRIVNPTRIQIQTAINGTLTDELLLNTFYQIKTFK